MKIIPKILLDNLPLNQKYIYVSKKTYTRNKALHWHDFYEIQIIIDGELHQTINGTQYEMSKGYAYFLHPYDIHEYSSDKPVTLIKIQFNAIMLDKLISQEVNFKKNIITQLNEYQLNDITLIANKMLYEYNNDLPNKDYVLHMLLNCLIVDLLRNEQISPMQQSSMQIINALHYIHSHYNESLTLKQVANEVGLSPNYLCSVFKKEVGISFVNYLKNLRIGNAKTLLNTTDYKISKIASECGFVSVSHFMSDFRQIVGYSPTNYRNNNLK